jgi:hypothetical protein
MMQKTTKTIRSGPIPGPGKKDGKGEQGIRTQPTEVIRKLQFPELVPKPGWF